MDRSDKLKAPQQGLTLDPAWSLSIALKGGFASHKNLSEPTRSAPPRLNVVNYDFNKSIVLILIGSVNKSIFRIVREHFSNDLRYRKCPLQRNVLASSANSLRLSAIDLVFPSYFSSMHRLLSLSLSRTQPAPVRVMECM